MIKPADYDHFNSRPCERGDSKIRQNISEFCCNYNKNKMDFSKCGSYAQREFCFSDDIRSFCCAYLPELSVSAR